MLTDASEYPKDDIVDMYGFRRQVELDIRAIKITLDMDVLRCKTPEMVRKEMWTCPPAYNLIHRVMRPSAQEAGVSPRVPSFTAAVQTIGVNGLLMVLDDDRLTSARGRRLGRHGPSPCGQPARTSGTARDQTQPQGARAAR